MNTLFLHLSVAGEACHAWLASAQGLVDQGQGTLLSFAQRYPGTACVAFVPSSQCLFTTVTINAKQLRQATQSLAWLIEEQVGEDAENLHVIAGTHADAASTSLLAIARTTLQERLLELRTVGLSVIALLPDLLLLPSDENDWQISAWNNELTALRTGLLAGAVLEADMLELMLESALQEREALIPLTISAKIEDAGLRARVEAWTRKHSQIECHFVDGLDIESVLGTNTDWSKHPANLLQGKFSATPGFSLPPALRMAAIFVAAAFSIQLLSEWVYYGYYQHAAKKTEATATALYRQIFPEERRIVNLQRQLKTHLNDNAGRGSALPVLTKIAESLQGSGLDTQRVDFSGGVITLDVNARALGELDGLKQKLEGQGFHTEIVSANTQDSMIRGRLRVEGGA